STATSEPRCATSSAADGGSSAAARPSRRSTSSDSPPARASAREPCGRGGAAEGENMHLDFGDFEPLINEDAIRARVAELGREITKCVDDTRDLVVVGVLKGSLVFMVDLIRELPPDVTVDFLRLSSYEGGTESTGSVRFDFDLTQPIAGKHVLIVED